MPRKDMFHDLVKQALISDGWTVTHDPLFIKWKGAEYFPDLGAEKVIAAEKGLEKVAIEIKSFIGNSFQADFYEAIGKYDSYFLALSDLEPERKVILAVPLDVYNKDFQKGYVQAMIQFKKMSIVIYDIDNQSITKWIKY
jgi:hypothetical protein